MPIRISSIIPRCYMQAENYSDSKLQIASPVAMSHSPQAEPVVLLTHMGPVIPVWLPIALRQFRRFNTCRVLILTDSEFELDMIIDPSLNIEIVHLRDLDIDRSYTQFLAWTPQSRRQFQGQFWAHTTGRFVILRDAMERLKLENVFHFENDIMFYSDLASLLVGFRNIGKGLVYPMQTDSLAIPSLIYIRDLDAIKALVDFIYFYIESRIPKGLQQLGQSLERRYLKILGRPMPPALSTINDMDLLSEYFNSRPENVDTPPIIMPSYAGPFGCEGCPNPRDVSLFSRHFEAFGSIFDAAIFGQYLGGNDPRSQIKVGPGYKSTNCIYDPGLYAYRLIKDDLGRISPYLESATGDRTRLNNLHVHCKKLHTFEWGPQDHGRVIMEMAS